MRHYFREDYQPQQYYTCGHGCGNVTFSTLPKSFEKQTEIQTCTRCGVTILFSTLELPKKIGHPRSRRLWGETVNVFRTARLVKAKKVKQAVMKYREPLLPNLPGKLIA